MEQQENADVRWRQRFQNFQKILQLLKNALSIASLDDLQRAGIIQFFEITFELGWKVLKDYLEEEGFHEIATPRSVIKKAFEIGLISNGRGWLKGLDDRNLTSHTYDELTAQSVEALIRKEYLVLFEELAASMENRK